MHLQFRQECLRVQNRCPWSNVIYPRSKADGGTAYAMHHGFFGYRVDIGHVISVRLRSIPYPVTLSFLIVVNTPISLSVETC